MPHTINNATYQESHTAFSSYAKEAAAFGAVMNYGSQPITPTAVQASSDTPLNLTDVNQDCEYSNILRSRLSWELLTSDFRARRGPRDDRVGFS